MALAGYPKTQKSIKIALVKNDTIGDGTHFIDDELAGSNTYFMIKNVAPTPGNQIDIEVVYVTGGPTVPYKLFAGDILEGPFVQIAVTTIGTSGTNEFNTAMIYYQEI